VLLFAATYLLYAASRWVVTGELEDALRHTEVIVALERQLGILVESSVQHALDGTAWLWLLNHAYLAAQVAVLPAALVWLYRHHQGEYRTLRDTIVVTWLLALPVFWLFPVAPPRLAELGITDTITAQTGLALDAKLTTSFYNPLAAVPSLHCGFALAVSIALARAVRHLAARALAVAWTPLICLAVVATGNHFVLDIVAGLAITTLGFVLVYTTRRSCEHARA
jgi:membrane-associated phospholipid phosphatase